MTDDERTPLLAADQERSDQNTIASSSKKDTRNKIKDDMISFLAATTGGILLAALDSTIVTTAYARIGSDMNQLQRASWIATSYMMGLTAFQPLYGKLSDIFGRKSCLLSAHSVFGIGCLACALSNSMSSLIAARIISGVGGAGLFAVVTVSVSDIVPLRQRGTWQGIINLIYSVGTSTGPPLGGILVDNYGWRWGFIVQVPICVVGFIAILFFFPNIERRDGYKDGPEDTIFGKLRRVDFLGSFLLIVIVFSLVLGLDKGSNVSWVSPIACVSLTVATLGTIGLVIVESNPSLAKEPVAPLRFFRNGNLVASFFTAFSLMSVGSSTTYQIALYAQVLNRRSASQASICLVPVVLGVLCGTLIGGILTQTIGKYRKLTILAHVGASCSATLCVAVAYFQPSWDLAGITSSITILSFFAGVSSTTLLVALLACVDPSDQASATAISLLFRSLGSVIGLSISSAIMQQILRIALTQEFSQYDVEELVRRVRESLTYIDSLDPVVQTIVRKSYAQGLLGAFTYGAFQSTLGLLAALFVRDYPLGSK